MAGWLALGQKRDYREQAKLLSIVQVATSRDRRGIKARLRELEKLGN